MDLIGYHEGDQLMDNHGHLLVDSVHGSTMMNAWEERATEDCCCEHLHILLHILLDIHSPPFHLHILHLLFDIPWHSFFSEDSLTFIPPYVNSHHH